MKTSIIAILLLALTGPIQAGEWPKLKEKSAQCAAVLEFARTAFQSTAEHVYDPVMLPENSASALMLSAKYVDITGGDSLQLDDAFMEKFSPKSGNDASIYYWQKTPVSGQRMAVRELHHSWRGSQYSLFSVDAAATKEALFARADSPEQKYVFDENWRPPILLREKQSGQAWAIDVGHPASFLGNWFVYAQSREGLTRRCEIQFRPNVKRARELLPNEVQALAVLLGQTHGSGENEGTMQSTASIRIGVEHTLANAALRPWALDEPYNDRKTVDAGLLEWSTRNKARKTLYERIIAQYPLAEKALARYYREKSRYSAEEAKALANKALDIAFRSHFVFSKN